MGDRFMEPIKVDALTKLQKQLKTMENASPSMLRLAMNDVGQVIVNVAKPRVPRRTGRAAATIRPASTATKARVQAGGTRAPYFPWLDYGGRVGREKSILRPFVKTGRIIYPAYLQEKDNIFKMLQKRLDQVVTDAGLDVDNA